MSVCKFNYKYIKDKATPGSWRRGYEGYQKDIVMSYDTKLAGVDAKVKGNFKDAYETSLTFTKNGVKADCSCPLKEEWCKHAIAVGLKVIEDKVYDEYLERVHKIKPEYPDEFVPPLEHPTGRYVFHFNPKRRQNFFSILVMDRETGKVIRDLEAILRAIIEVQRNDKSFILNDEEKIEIAIFQLLLQR